MASKKILICEDHDIVVDGIRKLFTDSNGYNVVGHAKKEEDLFNLIREHEPDILLLDLNLGNTDGFRLLENLRKGNTRIKVLILTMYDNDSLIEKARSMRANGFLLKNAGNNELLEALSGVYEVPFYIPGNLQARRLKHEKQRDDFIERMKLTRREIEIISHVARGRSNEEIAEALFVSPHTVKTHRKNILKKLNLSNAADVVRFAYENHLL